MSDPRFTIDAIRPLVSQLNPTGRHLVVTFTCPVTRKHVNARWSAPQQNSMGSAIGRSVQQSMWYEMRRQAHSLMSSALGHGMAGRIASQAMDTAMYAASPSNQYGSYASSAATLTPAEQERGVIEAFKSVSAQFTWTGREWVHGSGAKQLLSGMEAQLAEHPLANRYDRLLAARMLYEVAAASGGVTDEERSQLEEVMDPELGSLQLLSKRPPLTRAELGEASPGGVRVTLMALAWTLAYADERFDAAEGAKLQAFAQGLQLREPDQQKSRDLARTYVLDQLFDGILAHGHDVHAREHAVQVGQRLGMNREEVEVAEARWLRRRG
jgi:uncharacterized tellurite resistance protein B-like protein